MTGSRRIEDANTRHAVEAIEKELEGVRDTITVLQRYWKQAKAPVPTPAAAVAPRKRKPSRKSTS